MAGPTFGDNGVKASKEDLTRMTGFIIDIYQADKPDLHNPEAVHAAIMGYFTNCQQHNVRPGNLGLYAALGMSRQDYNNAVTGKSKSKVSPECIDMMKNAVRAIGVYREGLALEGKLHPTTYIFMGKNYDGLEDYTRLEVTPAQAATPQLSPAEIQKQIEQDIPIDSEYRELSDN